MKNLDARNSIGQRNGRSSKQLQPSSWTKQSKEQTGSYSWSTKETKKKVHFASLMDIYHFKNVELLPTYQKYTGRVALRGDIVKDVSGDYAVFTEQDSSASQVTAKVSDVIPRLPDCDGQAADVVWAYTQVKLEDAPEIAQKFQSQNVHILYIYIYGHVFHDIHDQYRGQISKVQWFFSKRNLHGHPLADLLWERQFEEVQLGLGWRKVSNYVCLFIRKKEIISSV